MHLNIGESVRGDHIADFGFWTAIDAEPKVATRTEAAFPRFLADYLSTLLEDVNVVAYTGDVGAMNTLHQRPKHWICED